MSSSKAAGPGPGRSRQTQIFVDGLGGTRPLVPVAPERLQEAARRKLDGAAFAYLAGGAGAERTMRANLEAFSAVKLLPRRLRGSAARDLSVDLFGHTSPAPVLLAPLGVLELAHPEADLAVGRAAAALGVPFIFSSQASEPMERVAAAMDAVQAGAPRWFQLYWGTDEQVTRSFVRRAEAIGAQAIVLTLDTTLLGWRPRDLDLGHLPFLRGQGLAQYLTDEHFRAGLAGVTLPAASPRPSPALLRTAASLAAHGRKFGLSLPQMRAAAAHFTASYTRPDLQWDDLSRLREWTSLPIVLKGILHPDDAREAARRGMDGLIVSNHGGRQIDGEVGSLTMLPRVVEAAGDLPVLLDSGVRTGADVAKALTLGARAVLLGRPYAYGLALAAEAGVTEVLRNIVAEFDLTLGLLGAHSARDLGPDHLA
ncbi:L-lactate 2-monooxygenase [Deinococcus aerolatus]|uniref:L-lactate 2-monooxygenase n=1 Tax=Deinococcus aerolatus TaxID=522487 RepID=A0ABQ2G8Z4_9DEIO|nr:alpha-hydroxy-acid oxidizing protein [Deinococcus aerolatus]GGL80543.1 L-lactate 2-monooxygenase [Deinococcus aerolatus]